MEMYFHKAYLLFFLYYQYSKVKYWETSLLRIIFMRKGEKDKPGIKGLCWGRRGPAGCQGSESGQQASRCAF